MGQIDRRRQQVRRTRMIIGIVVAVIIVIAAVVIFFLFRGKSTGTSPEELLQSYMNCIAEGRYEEMYTYLDEESQINYTQEEFVERNEKIYTDIEMTTLDVTVTEIDDEDKDAVMVSYDTVMDSLAGDISFSNTATFLLDEEEKEYKLVWSSELIFPDLGSGDKLRFETTTGERGSIYDRNGNLLAGKGEAASIGLVPGRMTESTDLDILAELTSTTVEAIESRLGESWVQDDQLVPIKTMQKSDAALIEEQLLEIPGVQISTTEVRVYPLAEEAAHLTGYIGNITEEELEEDEEGIYTASSQIGKSGLERILEERLRANDGRRIYIEDRNGEKKKELAVQEVEDGEDIYLTIDIELQKALYEQYAEDKSASVVMNPQTGEVLALVSTPAYDPNDFVLGISTEKWENLQEDEDNPLLNRYTAVWTPGSSFKPITAAIGVSVGAIDPEEDFGRSGTSWQPDESWGSYHVTTLKDYDEAVLRNALIYSDNIYFAKAALEIGADTLEAELDKLGFGESVPFMIGMGESSYANEDHISSDIMLADSGYGQGEIQVNPLHLATLYTAFSNDGNVIQPYLEYQESPDATIWLESAFSQEAVSAVSEGLIDAVNTPEGSGYAMKSDAVVLAGKTGTAEIKATQDDAAGTEQGWFCVYTTGTSPEQALLMLTTVEDVKDRGGSGYVVSGMKNVWDQLSW